VNFNGLNGVTSQKTELFTYSTIRVLFKYPNEYTVFASPKSGEFAPNLPLGSERCIIMRPISITVILLKRERQKLEAKFNVVWKSSYTNIENLSVQNLTNTTKFYFERQTELKRVTCSSVFTAVIAARELQDLAHLKKTTAGYTASVGSSLTG
jgi:hypothetical protein